MIPIWPKIIALLENELPSQDFNTWIRPLQVVQKTNSLALLAPNHFVLDWVKEHYLPKIQGIVTDLLNEDLIVHLGIGSKQPPIQRNTQTQVNPLKKRPLIKQAPNNLNKQFNFQNFIVGKSNQLAKAAATQVTENIGEAYNPLLIYGSSGLGKTHLMHAIGNNVLAKNPEAKIIYLHSERFVQDMVKALQHNTMSAFKNFYRNMDVLLIDDIQFFAGKERSQEEFFHTFNTLLENKHQIVLTSDKFPKEINGLEDRLKSRFGWGLPVSIDPPDLETRAAILMSKAASVKIDLPQEVAFFIGKRIRSNVRDLEGALRRVIANAHFTGKEITIAFTKEVLNDLIAIQDKLVHIDNIQKTVAEYYKIRVSDLHSKKRTRSITRPRQLAMTLARELTGHSLPEIGESFGGRDHTTVINACKKINELKETDSRMSDDYASLVRILTH